MISFIVKLSPQELSKDWDIIATSYYFSSEFLKHVHRYNYCNQRYYEMFENNRLIAATIVYSLPVNIFTFSGLSLKLKMNVLAIPVSISSEPVAGEKNALSKLIDFIKRNEKGLLLGLNLTHDYQGKGILNLRMLPAIVLQNNFSDSLSYMDQLRHSYRRKIKISQRHFNGVKTYETSCRAFSPEHYQLYQEIMKRTKTKLELLSFDFFRNLPEKFILTTHTSGESIICWNICLMDSEILYFFFGGMNYNLRDKYRSYNNNLLSILNLAIKNKSRIIDFGQTAELSKLRLGGSLSERRMFLFHSNRLVRLLLFLFKGLIENTEASKYKIPNVLKKSDPINENYIYSTETISKNDRVAACNDC